MTNSFPFTRRSFLGTAAVGAASLAFARPGWAADFPSRNVQITIPTGEGGGADRDSRIFTKIWQKYLDTNFEFEFYPGAAGQVGYEFYMNKEPSPYNLLFANMGPEVIMLTLQDPKIQVGRDITYIKQTLSEPMAVWVGPNSPIKDIQQLVDEGKKRPVTVSVSRLPHPASIGMLALGEATGASFNLVPYGGGNPSAMAAITGEVDCCALPITNAIRLDDQARILGVFADKNPAGEAADNAPTVNSVFGTKIPAAHLLARLGPAHRDGRQVPRRGGDAEEDHAADPRGSRVPEGGRGRRRAGRLHRSGRPGAGDGDRGRHGGAGGQVP